MSQQYSKFSAKKYYLHLNADWQSNTTLNYKKYSEPLKHSDIDENDDQHTARIKCNEQQDLLQYTKHAELYYTTENTTNAQNIKTITQETLDNITFQMQCKLIYLSR